MSGRITHTSSNIHLFAHIFESCTLIFSICALYSLSQPHHVTASHPSPGDNHQSTGGRPNEHRDKQKWPPETHSITYIPRLSTLYNLSRIVSQPPQSFLSCPSPPVHHPSSLTSVYLVSALHLLPPSASFLIYGTDPFFRHAQTISILSDLLYSITPFIF